MPPEPKAIKPSELSRVIVDTTVQPKNVTSLIVAFNAERLPAPRHRSGIQEELRVLYEEFGILEQRAMTRVWIHDQLCIRNVL